MLREVAPLAGAWIEMIIQGTATGNEVGSLPSRERGLKSVHPLRVVRRFGSLPSRERGLKSEYHSICMLSFFVAPLAGAWIEMNWSAQILKQPPSLPSRERGLKSS